MVTQVKFSVPSQVPGKLIHDFVPLPTLPTLLTLPTLRAAVWLQGSITHTKFSVKNFVGSNPFQPHVRLLLMFRISFTACT